MFLERVGEGRTGFSQLFLRIGSLVSWNDKSETARSDRALDQCDFDNLASTPGIGLALPSKGSIHLAILNQPSAVPKTPPRVDPKELLQSSSGSDQRALRHEE